MACSRSAGPPVCCAVTNLNTSAATTCAGGLPTTVKNTFRSYATAATVLGRDRTARNSRNSSSNGTPNRTTRSPTAVRDRRRPRSTQGDIQESLHRTHRLYRHWVNEDYLHIKQKRKLNSLRYLGRIVMHGYRPGSLPTGRPASVIGNPADCGRYIVCTPSRTWFCTCAGTPTARPRRAVNTAADGPATHVVAPWSLGCFDPGRT
jgi:hypothetical protein